MGILIQIQMYGPNIQQIQHKWADEVDITNINIIDLWGAIKISCNLSTSVIL